MVKNTIKLYRRFFSKNLTKKLTKKTKKTRGEMFCAFVGMTSLTLNSKLCNFITS